jgi:hypothetical protein
VANPARDSIAVFFCCQDDDEMEARMESSESGVSKLGIEREESVVEASSKETSGPDEAGGGSACDERSES